MNSFDNAPEYVHRYLMYAVTIQGKSPKTIEEYYYDIRMFLKYVKMSKQTEIKDLALIDEKEIKEKDILEVTTDDVSNFIHYLYYDRENKESARSRKLSSLRSFYKYLNTNLKVIDTNPANEIERPKKKKTQPIYLTLDESESLLEYLSTHDDSSFKERNYCIVTLFLNCGMRLEELVGIDMEDMKDDKLKLTGKGNKERTIYVNESCQRAINNYLPKRISPPKGSRDKSALFTSRQKNRISRRMVQQIIKESIVGAALNSKYTTHKLRHTAATLMYEYGDQDLLALQELLGHDNLSSTQIYTHVSDKQVKKTIKNNPLNKHRED